ncbi:MAG: hypothetical protein DWQ01_20635 [Planctomycetota bacterium]|nr:MAG: hypothetical protein DWQ01_20635 [Planctomycetota bacterium]
MLEIATGQDVGPYTVTRFIGRGAFAQVFRAEDSLGRPVALKFGDDSGGGRQLKRFSRLRKSPMPGGINRDEAPAEAFFMDPVSGPRAEILDASEIDRMLLAEAEILLVGQGKGVVGLREVVEKNQRPVLVLDYLRGENLRARVRRQEGIKLSWLVEVLRIIEFRLDSGLWICHGDLKPENIFVGLEEEITLLDPVPATEREDQIVATPQYNPFLRHDAKGDAQALAIMLYELLCGGVPFADTPWALAGLDSQRVDPEQRSLSLSFFLSYPRPREVNTRTPREIERAIFLALCDEAYGLQELRLDLENFLLRR